MNQKSEAPLEVMHKEMASVPTIACDSTILVPIGTWNRMVDAFNELLRVNDALDTEEHF